MDPVSQVLLLIITAVVWAVIGLAGSIWLDNRFFQRDVRSLGLHFAMSNRKHLTYIIFTTWAAMLVGPLMIIVAYYQDPLRRKVIHS